MSKPVSISIVNQATVPLQQDLGAVVAAAQKYLDRYFTPWWSVGALLHIAPALPPNGWSIVLLDDADAAGALGYHDITPNGMPFSRVFVKDLLANGETVSLTLTHELGEMLVDPYVSTMKFDTTTGVCYPLEVADAVEEDRFKIDGIPCSNFVTPAWFDPWRTPKSAHFDVLGLLSQPFELRPTGYASVLQGGAWSDTFGSQEKADRFAKENRALHRSEYRKSMSRLKR